MCNIKLKINDGDKGLELEMIDYKDSALKHVLDKLSFFLGGNAVKPAEEEEEYKEPIDLWREGYKALMSETEGLHDPGTEYTLPETIEEVAAAVQEEEKVSKEEVAAGIQEEKVSQVTDNQEQTESRKQLWYICECGNKKKLFVPSYYRYICCSNCSNKMMIRLANSQGPEYKDEYGNYFIAGEFRQTLKDKEMEDDFWSKNAS